LKCQPKIMVFSVPVKKKERRIKKYFFYDTVGTVGKQTRLCYPLAMEHSCKNYRLEAGIIFSYFIVSLLILFPLLPHLSSQLSFASNGDIRLSLTILFSNLKKITQGDFLNIFQLPIIFPLSHTLTAGINLFGQTLLVLPFYLVQIRNVYMLYNLLTFFSYIAAGYCAYRFVREWVPERWIAWIIGALYILMPYRVHNIPQLNLMFSFPIPLTLLFFSRFLKNSRIKDLVFFFLSFLSQFLFDLSVGLFLGITLGIFFLIRQILFGLLPRRSWLPLVAAAILFALAVALVFLPYLNQKTSFSIINEIKSIPAYSFHSPLSFYSNWSYLLLFFKRIFWQQSPFSPGISIFVFFLLAFAPYLENRRQKITILFCSSFLIIPALALTIIYRDLPFNLLNRICGWTLLMFLLSLALLLFLIRKKIPRELLLLTCTWMFLQFYSSQISLPFFNLFQGLARFFSVLLRARFIRTEYILLLLFFTVSAYGLSYFFRRFREKKIVLALVLLLIFAERIRWPVYPEKLKDDRPIYRKLYQPLALYPDHFGLLELPFYPQYSNYYPLFTIYHDKHTYHGLINYLSDYYQLGGCPQFQTGSKFSGLGDPQFTHMLKTKGIRLILLFKNKELNEDRQTWLAMQKQVRMGESKGLYEKIKKTKNGTLLVLSEREQGPQIRYFLPHYSLGGKKNLVCTINANSETEAEFLFNEKPVKRQRLLAGTQNRIIIDLQNLPLALQFNYLEIRSGPSLELIKVRIE
jgi:hypothetical protein